MTPLAIVTPASRVAPMAFFTSLVLLAVLDAAKTWYGLSLVSSEGGGSFGYISMGLFVLMVLFVSFLFINRRRDAAEGIKMFLLPVILALVISGIAMGVMLTVGSFNLMGIYAEEQGRDVMTVAQDPAFQEAFQAWMEDRPELALQMAGPAAWSGFAGFWATSFLFGFWFMSMKRDD